MRVNIHERLFPVPVIDVATLISTLASADDRLWPHEDWPRMRFDRGLVVGAFGGHGPVRYRVERVDPAGEVVFRFTGPSGFHGWHGYRAQEITEGQTVLREELRIAPRGWARITWPLFFRHLHDALIEESLDKAARELGAPTYARYRRPLWTRILYALVAGSASRRRAELRQRTVSEHR